VRNPNMKDPVDPSNLKMAIPLVKSLLIITGWARRDLSFTNWSNSIRKF